MATYYDVTLTAAIPQGSGILNMPCTVQFTYPDGSQSYAYNGTIFSWPTPAQVRITSSTVNIDSAWVDANGGTLTINRAGQPPLNFGIKNFVKVP